MIINVSADDSVQLMESYVLSVNFPRVLFKTQFVCLGAVMVNNDDVCCYGDHDEEIPVHLAGWS